MGNRASTGTVLAYLLAAGCSGASGGTAENGGAASNVAGAAGTMAAGGSRASGGAGTAVGGSTASGGTSTSSGGVSGGGAPSSGGTGVIDPGTCASLPAKGQWKNVTPPDASSVGSRALAIRPDYPATIYSGSDGAGIFRSTDCGGTWTRANTGTHASDMSSGSSWSLRIDPVEPDTMYAVVGYGSSGLWKSTNAGVDWNDVLTDPKITSAFYAGGFIMGADIDPTDHTHLVIESHGTCSTGHECGAESRDAGATWRLFDMAATGAWSENSSIAIIEPTTWLYCALFGGLYITSDRGASWSKLDAGGALPSCNYYNPYVYQADDGRYYLPALAYGGPGILRSVPNDASQWSLIAGSPQGTALVPTQNHLVVSKFQGDTVYIAPKSDPTTWTKLTDGSGSFLAYDGTHQVLYVSRSGQGGLWQIVTD